jgi:hypothetical protein
LSTDEFGGQKSKPLWLTWLGIEMPALFDFGDFTCVGLRLTTGIGLPNNVYTGLYPN